MIASLFGTVLERGLGHAVIDVQGVGYKVALSLLTLADLPAEGKQVRLRVQTVVREDAIELYGFLNAEDERMFALLTSVSHVGPKLALTVLSGLPTDELARAIAAGEVARLTRIHGVGKKTAERLVLELRDKVRALAEPRGPRPGAPLPVSERDDLVSALVNLGYKPAHAEKAADTAAEQAGPTAPFELLFREALRLLRLAS